MNSTRCVLFIATLFIVTFTACGPRKGGKTVKFPCHGGKNLSDSKTFRGRGIGQDLQEQIAQKIARINARENLAIEIESKLKLVADNYTGRDQVNSNSESKSSFSQETREVMSQTLKNAITACEEFALMKNGEYKCYMSVELDAKTLRDKLTEGLSRNDQLKLEFDKEKFRKVFDEEMEKLDRELPE